MFILLASKIFIRIKNSRIKDVGTVIIHPSIHFSDIKSMEIVHTYLHCMTNSELDKTDFRKIKRIKSVFFSLFSTMHLHY